MIAEQYQSTIDKIASYRKENKLAEAKEELLKLLEDQSFEKDFETTSEIFRELGEICFNLGELELSLNYYEQAITSYSKIGNVQGIAICYGGIGNVFLVSSEYAKAIAYFENSIEIYTKINNNNGVAQNTSNLGLIFIEVSDYPKAIECLEKALSLNEQVGNKQGIATNLGNFGIVYYYLQDFERAIEYYQKAIKLYDELGSIYEKIPLLGNIASVYLHTKKFDQSIVCFEEALQLSIQGNYTISIASNYGNLGIIYKDLQKYTTAIKYYKLSLEINEKFNIKTSIAINFVNLAEVFVLKGDFLTAQTYLDNSINLGNELKSKHILQECYKLQSEIFEATRKYKKSIQFFRKYIAIKEEIQTENSLQKAILFDEKRKIDIEEKHRHLKIARFEEQEKLLHNILPINIADRILQNETFIADYFESVSVLFMDLVGFTPLSSIAPPKQLVYLLDTIFTKADEVIESFGLEKIKTIGDGYLAVANVTKSLGNHQKATALAAIALMKTMKDFEVTITRDLGDLAWIKDKKVIEIRIGIHTGEVVAGVIGKNKYTYDLWGDAVNIASRMESNSEPWKIHISESFSKAIENHSEFSLIPRGEIMIKGKGLMNTFWLEESK